MSRADEIRASVRRILARQGFPVPPEECAGQPGQEELQSSSRVSSESFERHKERDDD
jgi:hypothetical protein